MDRLAEIATLLQDPASISAEQLAELEAELVQIYDDLRGKSLDDQTVADLKAASELIKGVRTEQASRAEAEEALRAQLEELDREIHPGEDAEAIVLDEETTEPDEDGEEEIETVAETVEEDETKKKDKVPVTASGRGTPLDVLAQRAGKPRLAPRANQSRVKVTASADIPDRSMGSEFQNRRQLGEAFISKIRGLGNGGGPGSQMVPIARINGNFSAERDITSLRGSEIGEAFNRISNTRVPMQGLTAAGGVCGPSEAYYGETVVGTSRRPVRDSLPSVRFGRGQITYPVPLTLASIGTTGGSPSQAIDVISEASLAAGYTKLYQEIDCGSELNVKVEAITKRVRFGNLNAIVQPERVAEIIDLTDVAFARVAELRLLTLMNAGSLQVTEQQDVGFSRDIFVYIRRAVSALRYRHRLDGQAFTAQIPRWGLDAFLSDVELGAYPTGAGAIKDEDSVTAYLARAGVRVVWTDESLVTPFAQEVTSTRLDLFPTQIKYLLYPEGTWIHGDAGTIDLGIVRDSALNAVNKYETFFESFETVAKMGAESYAITQTFCVNGGAAGTIAPNDICDGGS